jgi:DNA-binding winged helix-turn-helix (wHTH) protein
MRASDAGSGPVGPGPAPARGAPAPPSHPPPFLLGDWLVEPALDRLSRNGAVVHVRPQAMDVLVFLAGHAGEVVSHDETMAAVWRERFVNEYALTRCIADLRRALGEDARHTRYIENIPKRGYRVIASLTRIAAEGDAGGERPAPAPTPASLPAAPGEDRAADVVARPPARVGGAWRWPWPRWACSVPVWDSVRSSRHCGGTHRRA